MTHLMCTLAPKVGRRLLKASRGNWLAGQGSLGIGVFTLKVIQVEFILTPSDRSITLDCEYPDTQRT